VCTVLERRDSAEALARTAAYRHAGGRGGQVEALRNLQVARRQRG
jgi:hypothetical protein